MNGIVLPEDLDRAGVTAAGGGTPSRIVVPRASPGSVGSRAPVAAKVRIATSRDAMLHDVGS